MSMQDTLEVENMQEEGDYTNFFQTARRRNGERQPTVNFESIV